MRRETARAVDPFNACSSNKLNLHSNAHLFLTLNLKNEGLTRIKQFDLLLPQRHQFRLNKLDLELSDYKSFTEDDDA